MSEFETSANLPERRKWGGPQPGSGRPVGSRTKLSEAFFRDLAAEFERGGREALERARKEDPVQFCRMIASLIPKDVQLTGSDGGPLRIQVVTGVARADE